MLPRMDLLLSYKLICNQLLHISKDVVSLSGCEQIKNMVENEYGT